MSKPVTTADSPRPRSRLRRLILAAFGVLILIPVGLIIALPNLLNTGAGNRFVARRLDAAFAPGHLQFDTIRFAWFSPTRLSNVSLYDPDNKRVVTAPSATLSPTFWNLVRKPKRLGILDLQNARFDVARTAAGHIDLADALEGIFRSPDPERDLTIRATDARISLTAPALKSPIVPDRMNLDVQIRPLPLTLAWSVELQSGPTGSIAISGEFDRWRTTSQIKEQPDIDVNVTAKHWPFQLDLPSTNLKGVFAGGFKAARKSGAWASTGGAELPELVALLASKPADPISLENLTANWDVKHASETWTFDRLSLKSPIGWIESSQTIPLRADRPTKISGELDLAAGARVFGKLLGLREGLVVDRGIARLAVESRSNDGRASWSVDATLADLAAHLDGKAIGLKEPAKISASVQPVDNGMKLERMVVKTSFLDVSGSGDLDAGINVAGKIDLTRLKAQLADWFELKSFDVAGQGDWIASYKRAGETYSTDSRLAIKGFKLSGVSETDLEAAEAVFNFAGTGQADASGIPKSLAKGSLVVDAGSLNARAEVTPDGPGTLVQASAKVPARLFDRPSAVEVGFNGKFDQPTRRLDIESLAFTARATQEGVQVAPWTTSVKGKLDLNAGTLVLSRFLPESSGRGFELGDEGIRVEGLGQPATKLHVNAAYGGDVAAFESQLASWMDRPSRDLRGTWRGGLQVEPSPDGLAFQTSVRLDDLSWVGSNGERQKAETRLGLSSKGDISKREERIDVHEFRAELPFLAIKGHGSVSDWKRSANLDLRGEIAPDWQAATRWLAARYEPQARIDGKSSEFHVKGSLRGGKGDLPIEAHLALEVQEADLFGMQLGATPIHVHSRAGEISIDDINTTLNGGKLHLEPLLERTKDGGQMLVLDDGSSLTNARINDEVSHRVLSFVAPVLDDATRASGTVSFDLKRAEFPLNSQVSKKTNVTGSVVFQDVEFAPGPLADQLIGLVAPGKLNSVRLNEPVFLSIADGRINQRGLALPLGKVARLEMEGWVDFDKNINVIASIPFNPELAGNSRFLNTLVSGTRIQIPITGTLDKPKIDGAAMGAAMKDVGRNLLDRAVVPGLFDLITEAAKPKPRDPNAPPPPPRMTPAQRKAQRVEKQNERRRLRGLPPLPVPDAP